jgi:hypothetical protein
MIGRFREETDKLMTPDYSLSWILPFVRQSLRGVSNFTYDNFVAVVWAELERISIPGIARTPLERSYTNQKYDYSKAPYQLRAATYEAFHYLYQNGLVTPEPPQDLQGNPYHQVRYMLTQRGVTWAASVDPPPEDVDGYMRSLHSLVPNLDSVIEQYIAESLSSFERRTYFAAAVMVGAAAEKAVYLLADSIGGAIKDTARQQKFSRLIEQRRLSALLDSIEETIKGANQAIPYPILDGAVSHLMSLFEAIRVQRNDAVHPMNAMVSPDSIRLSLQAFPYALQKSELLREWFQANPKTI